MSKKPLGPWMPVEYEIADVSAIQALMIGEATPEQQKRAMFWIVEKACATYQPSFWPGGEEGQRNTDFAEGKRFVGNSIVKMTKLNVSAMRRRENEVS